MLLDLYPLVCTWSQKGSYISTSKCYNTHIYSKRATEQKRYQQGRSKGGGGGGALSPTKILGQHHIIYKRIHVDVLINYAVVVPHIKNTFRYCEPPVYLERESVDRCPFCTAIFPLKFIVRLVV